MATILIIVCISVIGGKAMTSIRKEIKVSDNRNNTLNLCMDDDVAMLGEVLFSGSCLKGQTFFINYIYKFKIIQK